MNSLARAIILIGSILFACIGVFPPWRTTAIIDDAPTVEYMRAPIWSNDYELMLKASQPRLQLAIKQWESEQRDFDQRRRDWETSQESRLVDRLKSRDFGSEAEFQDARLLGLQLELYSDDDPSIPYSLSEKIPNDVHDSGSPAERALLILRASGVEKAAKGSRFEIIMERDSGSHRTIEDLLAEGRIEELLETDTRSPFLQAVEGNDLSFRLSALLRQYSRAGLPPTFDNKKPTFKPSQKANSEDVYAEILWSRLGIELVVVMVVTGSLFIAFRK